jgi:hypothetical protein
MIDISKAEQAADFLRETAKDMETLWEQMKMKELMVRHVEGLLVKKMHGDGIPATVCKEYARAEPRHVEAGTEDAQATAALKGLEARRDAAKIVISLYQSSVKDRM